LRAGRPRFAEFAGILRARLALLRLKLAALGREHVNLKPGGVYFQSAAAVSAPFSRSRFVDSA